MKFTVNAVPIAQPRQRIRVMMIRGRTLATNYTPKTSPVQDFKASVRMAASEAYQGEPLSGPLTLRCIFVLPRPGRLMWKTRPMPRERHITKPDVDNLLKSVTDALNQLLWRDDSQVAEVLAEKWIAAGDEQPHVEINIEPCQLPARMEQVADVGGELWT